MTNKALLWLLAALALLAAACSEPAPSTKTAGTSGTDGSATAPSCRGTTKLLACAKRSTLGDLVPEKPVKATKTPITLGMVNQENTPAGSFPELSKAAQAAADFVNANLGGVDGHPIRIKVCNTKFSAEGSTTCGQQLVEAEVPAVLGGIDVFGNAIDTLAKNDIPYVGGIPISTQSVTAANSFQWSGGSWGAMVAFADHASRVLKAKNVAVVYSEFGSITESATYGEKVLKDRGVKVELVPFPIMATDISGYIQAAAANDPDAIVVLGADTSCKGGFDALDAIGLDGQAYFTGACAAPTITEPLGPAKTDGTIFNVEGPINRTNPNPDGDFYAAAVNAYGKGLNPIGAGTVSFRSFMNLYAVLRGLGADHITPAAITKALRATTDEPSFMGHPYTCDGKQFEGLPAMCSPQQILARIQANKLSQIGDWIDVGAIYAG